MIILIALFLCIAIIGLNYYSIKTSNFIVLILFIATAMMVVTELMITPKFFAINTFYSLAFYLTAILSIIVSVPLVVYTDYTQEPTYIRKAGELLVYGLSITFCYRVISNVIFNIIEFYLIPTSIDFFTIRLILNPIIIGFLVLIPFKPFVFKNMLILLFFIILTILGMLFYYGQHFSDPNYGYKVILTTDTFKYKNTLILNFVTLMGLPIGVRLARTLTKGNEGKNQLKHYKLQYLLSSDLTIPNDINPNHPNSATKNLLAFKTNPWGYFRVGLMLLLAIIFYNIFITIIHFISLDGLYSLYFVGSLVIAVLSFIGFYVFKYGIYDVFTPKSRDNYDLYSSPNKRDWRVFYVFLTIIVINLIDTDVIYKTFSFLHALIITQITFVLIPLLFSKCHISIKILAIILTAIPIYYLGINVYLSIHEHIDYV